MTKHKQYQMQTTITIKNEYNTLDSLHKFLKTASGYECSKEYDAWEHRTDANGEMAQCIVLKKSNMHAIKAYFIKPNTVKIDHIIPNKMMQAYFGKSVKSRKNIVEIITGSITQAVLAGSQKKAFSEMEQVFSKISA